MTRFRMIGTVLSTLLNVCFGRRGALLNSNIELSVRAHLEPWPRLERAIDRLLWRDRKGDKGHCALAVERERQRCRDFLDRWGEP